MKNQFAKIVAVLMVLAMAVSVFGLCASAAEEATDANVVLLGDVNLDGKVTIQDATLIQKAIAKLATLDEVQTAAADATEDGEVNIKDATAIQKWIAKVAGANENIGQPMATADEATVDEATTDEATVDEATVDEATVDEATTDEATTDEATTDEATTDEPVVEPEVPATEDQTIVDEPTTTYNVAGAAGLCGAEWDPAANQMTDDGDGTWSITFTGVAAGTYEFKVVENGAWGNPDYNLDGNAANGGANASVTVTVDDATVIIGFDGEKAVIEFVTEPTADDETVVDPATADEATADEATTDESVVDEPTTTYNVAGEAGLCGTGWDPTVNQMTYDGDGTWSITFTGIAAGTYQFKVVEGGAWGNPDYNLEGNAANGGANASVTVEADNATVVIGFDGEKAVIESIA